MGEYNRNRFTSMIYSEQMHYEDLLKSYVDKHHLYDKMFGSEDPWVDEYTIDHLDNTIFVVYQKINYLWDEIKTRFSYLPEEKLKRKFKKYLKHPQWEYIFQALFKSYDMTVGKYAIRKEYAIKCLLQNTIHPHQ